MDHQPPGKSDESFEICWNHLTYGVKPGLVQRLVFKSNHEPITILDGLTGRVRSGELTALMGTSGAGKSTLMLCIKGLVSAKQMTGSLEVKGQFQKIHGMQIALVPQQDDLFQRFTVRETILFASKLKNSHYTSKREAIVVSNVINELQLTACAETLILNCSGGEQKRVSIACELVSRPDVLMLDEPTSGLDISTSINTVKLLQRLAHANRIAVMASIHQPSSYLFTLFDHVIVLAKGGISSYAGSPADVPARLHEVGIRKEKIFNPADTLIEIAAQRHGAETLDLMVDMQRQIDLNISRRPSSYFPESPPDPVTVYNSARRASRLELMRGISTASLAPVEPVKVDLSSVKYNPKFPFLTHFGILLWRTLLEITRNPFILFIRLFAYTFIPLMVSQVFGLGIGGPAGCPLPNLLTLEIPELVAVVAGRKEMKRALVDLNLNFGYVFMTVLGTSLLSLAWSELTFPIEMKITKKQCHNSWYGISTYFLARVAAELPFQLLSVTVYCATNYYFTGQPLDWYRFGGFTLIVGLVALISQTFGFIAGAIFMDDVVSSVIFGTTMVLPYVTFNNFLLRDTLMVDWLKPMNYSSYFYYAFNGLIAILYGFERCKCDPVKFPVVTHGGGNYSQNFTAPEWVTSAMRLYDATVSIENDDNGMNASYTSGSLKTMLDRLSLAGVFSDSCESYQPLAFQEYHVTDDSFAEAVTSLTGLLLYFNIILYIILRFKI